MRTKLIVTAMFLTSFAAIAVLPVFAQTPSPTPAVTPRASRAQIDVACVQNAIDKRDGALVTAIDAYATAVKSALSTRDTALKAAWAFSGHDRVTALRSAWKAYRDSARQARKDLMSARHGAWKQFNTDRRACGRGGPAEPGGGEGADAGL